jgi:hypothetical protein
MIVTHSEKWHLGGEPAKPIDGQIKEQNTYAIINCGASVWNVADLRQGDRLFSQSIYAEAL